MASQAMVSVLDRGVFDPCPARFNMARHTLDSGQEADKTALLVVADPADPAEVWSYAELRAAVRGTMTGLADAGVRPGDRVLLRLGHSVDFPILFFALTGMGAVPVPTSSQLTGPEVAAIAANLAPALTVAAPGIACPDGPVMDLDRARTFRTLAPADWANTAANDAAYIVFTSGTGGRPKGVVHAHRAAWARRMMWRDWYDLTPDDRLLHAGAFNWTYTLGTGLTDPWAIGATAIIHTGPTTRGIWADIAARHHPTIFAAVPGVYRQLLSSGADLAAGFRDLRHALSAGEALHPRIAQAWQDATATQIHEALGMSEVSTYLSASPAHPNLTAQTGRRVAILDDDAPDPVTRGTAGRLAVSSRDPGLMKGYWHHGAGPDLPLTGEWFVTGDRAVMEPDGTIRHLGRGDDILNAQGYRVSAREVEDALTDHPAVAEAAAVALPVRPEVEILAAFVAPAPDATVTEDDLAAHCASRLAGYKCPKSIRVLPALPRTATGKVLKRALIDEYGWKDG